LSHDIRTGRILLIRPVRLDPLPHTPRPYHG
jgi:hypothetical protein